MKLRIEKWIDERRMLHTEESEAIELFKESIMCYKIGAYRSSYIMSYLAFETIVKNRILNTKDLPAALPAPTWENMKNRLKDDNSWEEELSNIIKQGPPPAQSGRPDTRLFKYKKHDAMVNEYNHWKNIRNACAHYKHNTVDNSTVESLWNFIMDDLEEFHVGGSIEHLTNLIIDSFNISKSDERDDYSFEISKLVCLMDSDELSAFLNKVDIEYDKLSDSAVESNYKLFYKQLTLSENETVRDALYKYLTCDLRIVCSKFEFIYDNYRYFVEDYLSTNVDYRKTVWSKYLAHFQYLDGRPWHIFKIYCNHNLLSEQELGIFFDKALNVSYILISLISSTDAQLIQLLQGKGMFQALSDKIDSINFKDFETANSKEKLLFCGIKYCNIGEKLYNDTYFLLKQRLPGRTIYDTIKDLLTNNPDIKDKYIQFENTSGKSDVSGFFGW